MKKYFLILLTFLTIQSVNSQINVKIGYGTAFVNAKVNNSILSEFNDVKRNELSDSLSIPFKGLNFMHGLDLGLRFKVSESSAFELSWQNLSRSREAVGEINDVSLFKQELFYSFNQLYVSYQSDFNGYGMGVGLGYNKVKAKDRIAGSDFKETVINESQLFAKINLSIYFKSSSSVSFAIQPYYQFSLADINLNPLRTELGLSESGTADEPFNMFGISFVFYNGRQ
jgi:hypothetical protein